MPNLSSVIKSIQDVMRPDSGVDGDAQRISQLRDAEIANVPFMASAGGMQCQALRVPCGYATQASRNAAMRPPVPPEMGYLAFLHPSPGCCS